MGCSISKLDNEETVQLCKDRNRFIKLAIESRIRFAAGHVAYIQSLRRVSLALRDYIEGYEHCELFLNSYTAHPFTPIKKTGPEIIAIPLKSLCATTPIQSHIRTSQVVNYLRSGGNPSVSIEEKLQSPEIMRVESYSPMHRYRIEGFFDMQSPPTNSSFFSSPCNKPNYPPPSPQTSQWDLFWDPFSSLGTYGYTTRESLDQLVTDGGTTGLRPVCKEEGIPNLEEEHEERKEEVKAEESEERAKIDSNCAKVEGNDSGVEIDIGTETEHEAKGLQSQGTESIEVSEAHNAVELEVVNEESGISDDREATEETPGFTVYVDRRPTSMAEVVKDLETQFMLVCDSAKEISTMLEASKAQFSSTANELTAAKMLNPVALFRSTSSRSTSRPFHASSSSRDDGYDSSSDISEESLVFSGSHHSTLDRLYAWEKKLYEEVKSGERIRIAYEKKCMQLKNQDVKGEDPSVLDKTRAAMRDLNTQIKVSMHSVESVSKRIETLRDEELQPQLLELIQGLSRMWRAMADCHRYQTQTIEEAGRLLADRPPKPTEISAVTQPFRFARSATILEAELRNWRNCFESWIAAQRSYVRALASWALRCSRPETDTDTDPVTEKISFSPRRSIREPPIFAICIQWSRGLEALREGHVMDGLDLLADGVRSSYGRDGGEEGKRSKRFGVGVSVDTDRKMELVEREEVGVMTEEVTTVKTEETAVRALCVGMSVAVGLLTEFAVKSGEVYEELAKQWEKDTWAKVKVGV